MYIAIYILFILILIIIFIKGYIKIKYGFWAIQPVFHVYNINYMIFPPGIIEHKLPIKNKYTNFKNIETLTFDKLSDYKFQKFTNFIQLHYLQNKDNIYLPKKENIIPYFTNHFTLSLFSFYLEDINIINLKKGTVHKDNKIIGVMTSRPVRIIINKKDTQPFNAYYIDYLCVDHLFRKKGIAPQIIQTHNYNQRLLNKSIHVSLFKREDELTGIVPLCAYNTYGFALDQTRFDTNLCDSFSIIEITSHNFNIFYNYIKENLNKFDIVIYSEIYNILELIKTKNIFVYVIIKKDIINNVFFFRKTCINISLNNEVLSCFASINTNGDDYIFINSFNSCIRYILKNNTFGFLAIENISHNNIIINKLIKKTKPIIISPTAYFFYNFAYPTFQSNKVLIIN